MPGFLEPLHQSPLFGICVLFPNNSRKSGAIEVRKWREIGHHKIPFCIWITELHGVDHTTLIFFSLMSRCNAVMSCWNWYRGFHDQSVHINETFKGYHCILLHQTSNTSTLGVHYLIQEQLLYQIFVIKQYKQLCNVPMQCTNIFRDIYKI